ncbi:MAG: Gfo/Idh/MocA family oxidoreductase [Chloroflexi bacterium]|nr:Gfo/Idh/MocA family oxidoreductase [Chloroflexota bacterium]
MTDRVRVAVIGCGAQGQVHLRGYQARPDVELVACCDLDPARLEAIAREFGPTRVFADYRDMLDSVGIDLVSVCTMPATHRTITSDALSAGAHVLVEKPMAMNVAEAEEMVKVAQANHRLISVGTNMRWMGSAQFCRRLVDEGQIGPPRYARAFTFASYIPWWGKHHVRALSGGGALASTAVHVLDLILWVMGNPEPLTVSASMTTRFPASRGDSAPSPEVRATYDVEDLFSAHVRLAGERWLTLEGAWGYDSLADHYGFDLSATHGRITFDPLSVIVERDGKPVDVTPAGVADADWPRSVWAEIGDMVLAAREGHTSPTLVTPEQALTVQRIQDAIYQSAESGREVRI